jgi:hypothetical protein
MPAPWTAEEFTANARPRASAGTRWAMTRLVRTFRPPLNVPPTSHSGMSSNAVQAPAPPKTAAQQAARQRSTPHTSRPESTSPRASRPNSSAPISEPTVHEPLTSPNTVVEACSSPRMKKTSMTLIAPTPPTTAATATTMVVSRRSPRSRHATRSDDDARTPRRVRSSRPAATRDRYVAASRRSGSRVPNWPTRTPAKAGAINMPVVPAVWLRPLAFARSSRRTMAGSNAASVGWVTARPQASTPTRAMITAGRSANARAPQTAACATPAVTRTIRLSTRSAIRPVSGASTTSGTVAASISAETARPPVPACWNARASAVAARKSPQLETARAPAAT